MIFNLIWIVICVILCSFIVNGIEDYRKNKKSIEMSFKEAIDLAGVPVITFVSNGINVNLLLDTGANNPIIDKSILDKLEYKKTNFVSDLVGLGGKTEKARYVSIDFKYKEVPFNSNFQVIDMSAPFGEMKKNTGVTIHGLIGSSFFKKYRYILDFDELKAYIK
jgi:hypothetical protein